jgi:molybdate transport system ATP-binding protein
VTLSLRGVVVRKGSFSLAADFEIPAEGVTVVFGPSGSGKSTLLSTIAGLNRLEAGRIEFKNRVLENVSTRVRTPAHERGIGLVFQDARLFPHLTVKGNLEYAERRRPAARNAPITVEIARRLEFEGLLPRPVRNLSGGERGRVALARAIVSAPELLLLDEPFVALDSRRRRDYLILLRDLSREQGVPMMVVTHHIDDAAELADHVVTVRDGSVTGFGRAADVMGQPDFTSMLDRRDLGARLPAAAVGGRNAEGVWVRADSVLLASEEPRGISARHVWKGQVATVTHELEGSAVVSLATEAGYILSRITLEALAELRLESGATAWAVVKANAL